MRELETRAYNFEIRATEDNGVGVLTGRPIVYNQRTDLGWFDEIIDGGALDEADLTDVRFLINHDFSRIPLARSRRNNGNSTMQFSLDQDGMILDWVKLDIKNNTDARSLYSAIERGDISGMSFAFSISGEAWENLESDHPTRHITHIESVVEVSAVTFPAYQSTSIHTERGDSKALDSAKDVLERARADAIKGASVEDATDDLELLKLRTKLLTL